MRMLWQKRGSTEHSLWTIIDIILVGLLIFSMITYVSDLRQNTFFKRSVLSKDIATIMDIAQSLPGDMSFNYIYDGDIISDFNFNFYESKIVVADARLGRESSYAYYDDGRIANNYAKRIERPFSIEFVKTGDSLWVGEGLGGTKGIKKCQAAPKELFDISKRIVFLAYEEEDDKGFVSLVNDYAAMSFTSQAKEAKDLRKPDAGLYSILFLFDFKDSASIADNTILLKHYGRDVMGLSMACNVRNSLVSSGKFEDVVQMPSAYLGNADASAIAGYKAAISISIYKRGFLSKEEKNAIAYDIAAAIKQGIGDFEKGAG